MNAKEFLSEVLGSNICPDNFIETYNEFCTYQNAALRTLQEFHRICENNHIPYQLAFGSLLGVIRDGGQIPWDYDVDVLVPYAYKSLLLKALQSDLNKDFYFYCPENNRKCRHVIMRLAPKGYRTEALHVDVFYYIGTPNNTEKRKEFASRVKDISYARFFKLVKPREESVGNLRGMLGLYKAKIPLAFKSLNKIEFEYEQLCSEFPLEKSEIYIEADIFSDWYEFPKTYLENTELVATEIGEFRVSSNYHELLSIIYNDYGSVPPLEKRIAEVEHNLKRLRYFSKL